MRETIVALLKEVRPDIDLREGSPLYIYLVDALAAIAGKLVEEVEAGRELSVNDSAEMFFVPEGTATQSESTIRIYFSSPESLEYSAGSMVLISRAGASYTNKLPVSMKASYMTLYTDETYYYHDVTITGESPISTETELIWDGSPESFSHIVITGVVSPGSLGLSSSDLSVRISRELALRNNISSPGITAFLSNMFTSSLVDILVQGFNDPEQQRDIYGNLHLGGYIDVYVKGTYPEDKTYKFDNEELDRDTTFAITITDSPYTLPHQALTSCVVTSWVRTQQPSPYVAEYTFVDGTDYDIDLANGVITLKGQVLNPAVPPANPIHILTGSMTVDAVSGDEFQMTPTAPNHPIVLEGDILDWRGGFYMVKAVRVDFMLPPITRFIRVERDIDMTGGAVNPGVDTVSVSEPVRVTYTYTPLGVELSDLDNPVLSLDSINILDPLTDEIVEDTVDAMPGFGLGNFGLGGYGRGNVSGYEFHVDDENLRYSIYEEGFIELPRDTDLERIGVDYSMDSFVSSVQEALDVNRTKTADIKAFAFIPCQVNMDLLVVDSSIDISSIRYMIWEMPGEMELTDIVNALYGLGQDPVKWSDFYTRSTYKVWKRDGSYVTVIPDADGIVTLSSLAERFLPQAITTRTS